MRQLQLGTIGRDIVTGFTGRLMAKATYLTGCDRYLITPQGVTKHDGAPADNMWADVITIEVLKGEPLFLPQNPSRPLELGVSAKSIVTDFEGVVTGRVQFLSGSVEYVLQAPNRGDGKVPPSIWVDSCALEQLNVPKIVLPQEQAPEVAPVRGPGPVHPAGASCYPDHPGDGG